MLPAIDHATNQSESHADGKAVAAHVKQLLRNGKEPVLTPDLARIPDLADIHSHLSSIRKTLGAFASGNFACDTPPEGVLGEDLHTLQEKMRTMLKQIQLVESGHLDERVDFIGEFAAAFNSMTMQLGAALMAYQKNEAQLAALHRELQRELERRSRTMVQLTRSEEEFKFLADHDPLTGLLNRRSFFAQANIRMRERAIMREWCSLVLLDVDHFKKFNDTYGHQQGDLALKHLADTVAALLRPDDLLGRYGGEEFVIYFNNAAHGQAITATERIKGVVGTTPVPLITGPVGITASFGVISIPPATIPSDEFDLLEFSVGLADAALYDAKFSGRNRVCTVPFPLEILPGVRPRH